MDNNNNINTNISDNSNNGNNNIVNNNVNNVPVTENTKEKKKKNILVPIIIVVVVAVLSIIGVITVVVINNSNEKPKTPEVDYDYDDDEKVDLSDEEAGNMINDIILIAYDIYEKGTYTQFTKGENGYYATVGEIRALGYENIDSMVIGCSDGHAIMFFDVDHKDQYQGYPVIVVHECTGVTLQ